MKSLEQLTYVADSSIHGNGLFARVALPKGTVIGELTGKSCKKDGSYVLWLSETEGFQVTCNLKYINHADDANACYYDDLSVVALRKIAKNEEITHDYGCDDW